MHPEANSSDALQSGHAAAVDVSLEPPLLPEFPLLAGGAMFSLTSTVSLAGATFLVCASQFLVVCLSNALPIASAQLSILPP